MTTESEPSIEAAPAVAPVEAPAPAPIPRITPAPESGDRLPHMIERTRRRGRRRRAPVFTPQEVKTIDYKDVDRLKKLISDRGRIEPRRKTGLTAKDQRKIAREIKRARQVALLPYTAEHMRQTSRFRMVTRMAQRAMRAELDDAPPSEPAEGGAALEEPVNESAQVAAQVAPESVTEVATDAAPEVAAEAAPKVSPEAVAEVAAANEESSV
jgi:small subunit ribosomal protein S18